MTRTCSLVGRRRELDQLLALVARDDSMVVVGDAGVGKTRLVAEVVSDLRREGRLVVTAGCLPLAAPLPLLPIVDVAKMLFEQDEELLGFDVLKACPAYVREELVRLLPELGAAASVPAMSGQGWQQQRLFAALLDFFRGISARRPWTMVLEDVHWSDSTSRDFLTYLLGHRVPGLSVLLTARRADPEAAEEAIHWLRNVSSAGSLTEIDLGPLSRNEVRELTSRVRGSPLPDQGLADLYRRAEGNAFFTEQLLAAQEFESTTRLPDGLAQLLLARVSDLDPTSRRVLEALAVAERPLLESELVQVGRGQTTENRRALRDLLTRQLVRVDDGGAFSTKHALLGEAVTEALLPGERADLSGSIATVLLGRGDPALAGEAADHLAKAGRSEEELLVRVDAAEYAESVSAFLAAAREWERATALAESQVAARARVGELALRTMIAWDYGGDMVRGEPCGRRGLAAARAQGQRQIEAALLTRLAALHPVTDAETGLSEYREAIELFGRLPPSAEEVQALRLLFQFYAGLGRHDEGLPYLRRAVAMGNSDSRFASELVSALISQAGEHLRLGDLEESWAVQERARTLAETIDDPQAIAWLAMAETYGRLQLNLLDEAVQVGERALLRLRTRGFADAWFTSVVLVQTVEVLLELGRVDDAAGLISRTVQYEPASRHYWPFEEARSRVNLAQGQFDVAARRVAAMLDPSGQNRVADFDLKLSEHRVELALWQGRPVEALEMAHSLVRRLRGTKNEHVLARPLVQGMRACADIGSARDSDRGDLPGPRDLTEAWRQLEADPFRTHEFYVAAVVDGAEWRAETQRALGQDDAAVWEVAAAGWEELGRPHRAAYARWRQSEALFRNGDRRAASACLRIAWQEADQHVPLRNEVSSLARMARADLAEPRAPVVHSAQAPTTLGLTVRELDVLRLLVDGLTNAEIGARLYMSPKTASVHVTSILRKLGATNRVHAATLAQRHGLVDP